MKQLHNEPGHLNIYVLDHDSAVTGNGLHDRVVAFLPSYCEEVDTIAVHVRIDHKWQIGMPNDKQVIKAFKKDQCIGGQWKKTLEEPWPSMNATAQWYEQSV